ncbi:MAG: TAT-variant-translocated molybdopterin oxidoreductase [Myxococcales bacterium]
MSKRLPILPPSRPDDFDADGAPALWRSVEGREQSPEVREAQQREFPPGASELKDAVSRRSLLKFATLSTAIASLEGCANPAEPIMPFTRRPEDLVPGNPLHFATAMPFEGYGSGLLAVSNEGRPTKLEGNPEHPTSLGATSVFGQAAVLQLYDRARARGIVGEGRPQGWRAFLTSLVRRMDAARAQDGGARVRFLMEPSSSPLQQHLRSRIQQVLPNARFYSWSPVNHDAPRAGARVAFGRPLDAHYQFENADVVVSLDSDFLECTPDHLRHARAFTARRDPDAGPMNRLYAFEANLTTTGAFADHRFRAKSAEIQAVATALLARVAQAVPAAADASPGAPQLPEHLARAVEVIAKDLVANRGRSLIIAGERQPPAVHAVAHALNSALGNVGPTVRYAAPVTIDAEDGSAVLRRLVEEINAGQVDTLLITAMNPVYAAPVDLEFAAALAKVPNSIYLGLYNDETAARTTWFLPSAHFLESWGDTRAVDGTVTLIQPLLQPLFGGATEVDVLSAFLGEAEKGTWAQLREYWSARVNRPDFDFWWDQALQRGFIEGTTVQFETPAADFGAVRGALAQARAVSTEGIEINFVPDYKVWDGRFASLGWDRTVAWCSYTTTRRPLTTLTAAGLTDALTGLGLRYCGEAMRG